MTEKNNNLHKLSLITAFFVTFAVLLKSMQWVWKHTASGAKLIIHQRSRPVSAAVRQNNSQPNMQANAPLAEITLLKDLAEILNQTLPPEKALAAGLELVAKHAGAPVGWILTLTPDGKSALAAGYHLPANMELADQTQHWELCDCLRESLEGRLNNPIRVYNCERLKRLRELPYIGKYHLSIPIRASGRPVGILNLVVPPDLQVSEAETRLISALGDQFGGAVERARLFQEVQKLAITDPLTGLYNRRYFFETAYFELERSLRYRRPLTLVILDIDNFKQVNDTYGHLSGDQVLKQLSETCLSSMRRVDIIGRFGGEELVILMPETAQEQAALAMERLRQRVEQQVIETPRGTIRATISAGMVSVTGEAPITFEEVLDCADRALYFAKKNGRNQVVRWKPGLMDEGN